MKIIILIISFVLNSSVIGGVHLKKLRKSKSRSDIPIEASDEALFEKELNYDLDRFENIQEKISQMKSLLEQKEENQTLLASRKLQDETELVKSVDEIKLLGKDLNEIGSIVKDLGENLTGHVARDIRKMLKDASVFLGELENQVSDEENFHGYTHLKKQKLILEEPSKLNSSSKLDKEWERIKVSSKVYFEKEESILTDDGDDPLVIAIIIFAIVTVILILIGILVKKYCIRGSTSVTNHKSFGYTDEFEKEEDIYLEDFGEGDFFEWPVKPNPSQAESSYQQKQTVVEYSKGFEAYCRISSNRENPTNL